MLLKKLQEPQFKQKILKEVRDGSGVGRVVLRVEEDYSDLSSEDM
jgi:hypothetical protein